MKRSTAILIAAVTAGAVLLACNLSFGETGSKAAATFDRNLKYDVYYAVSDLEVHVVRQVTIQSTAALAGCQYLKVRGPRLRSMPSVVYTDGYILADSVRAILPSEMPKPQRAFRND